MPTATLQLWLRIQALFWVPLLIAHGTRLVTIPWSLWPVAIGVSFVAVVAILRAVRTPADVVTIARLSGLACVAFASPSDLPLAAWVSILGLVLLDLVDGALARRFGATPQGAILDMEADQFTVLLLSLLVVRGGGGEQVLLVPAMRYVFVLAMWGVGLPAHDPKPVNGDNRRGRLCCALVIAALMAALWPGMNRIAGEVATSAAVLVLAFSFARDARFLLSRLRRPMVPR